MKFSVEKYRDGTSLQVAYSEDEPGVNFLGKTFRDDRYRILVSFDPPKWCGERWPRGVVSFCMQHLKLSEPPYSAASMPGRAIQMTREEFSDLVDALVELRDKVREAP